MQIFRGRCKALIHATFDEGTIVSQEINCGDAESSAKPRQDSSTGATCEWRSSVQTGRVVEVWRSNQVWFGVVVGRYEHGALVYLGHQGNSSQQPSEPLKVCYGEIVCVWPRELCPEHSSNDPGSVTDSISSDIEAGLLLLRSAPPRALSLIGAYEKIRQIPKSDIASQYTSMDIAEMIFPRDMQGSRERRAAAVVATALLTATDGIRFKRAGEGRGWRALPPSVAIARSRCSFLEACKKMLDNSTSARDRVSPWSRDHLEILRELEICAASGSDAKGTAATALKALGYEINAEGAGALLLNIGYWGTGSLERDGGGNVQEIAPRIDTTKRGRSTRRSGPVTAEEITTEAADVNCEGLSQDAISHETKNKKMNGFPGISQAESLLESNSDMEDPSMKSQRDWTFSPPILAEAREMRQKTNERRLHYMSAKFSPQAPRKFIGKGGALPKRRVYCVDDRNARFLDDAVSVEYLHSGRIVRLCIHVADVDEIIRSGSAIDDLAKERGQSLYLPLKPLHMLPAAAMEAASFSTTLPTDGITVAMEVDITTEELTFWEIFASIIPPVTRYNYDQFDAMLDGRRKQAPADEEARRDLLAIAAIVPILARRLDTRKNSRRLRNATSRPANGSPSTHEPGVQSSDEDSSSTTAATEAYARLKKESTIAAVRLVKKRNNPLTGQSRLAKVVDFKSTGAFAVIADLLLCASTLFRHFAHRHGAYLPEERGAWLWVSRCGTAPLRRYADLATQRQIKCILFGRQPAGRRRMEELRAWLAKRQAAGERSVALRRKTALFDSLADHCSQQRQATNSSFAHMTAKIRHVLVNRKNILRAEVEIDGTGISTVASVDPEFLEEDEERIEQTSAGLEGSTNGSTDGSPSKSSKRKRWAAQLGNRYKEGDRVRIHVLNVDTAGQQVSARVVGKV